MEETKLEKAQIHIALSMDVLPIPYPAIDHHDGTQNYGYFRLLDSPELAYEIPELQSTPPLQRALFRLHSPLGRFESVRLVRWNDHREKLYRECLCLGLVYRDRVLFSDYLATMKVCGLLLRAAESKRYPLSDPLYIEIQPAEFVGESARGWIMDVYLCGYGQSQLAALPGLYRATEGLVQLLEQEAAEIVDGLPK